MRPAPPVLLSLALAFVTTAAAEAADAPPWEAQPFAADGKEILKAAAAAIGTDRSDVVVLLEEGSFRFDAQGRCDYRYHLVYRIQSESGMRGWSSIGSG